MYEMLILSHGALASGYYQTMKMILGEEPNLAYCALEEGESSEELEHKLASIIDWGSGSPLLVMADIYSGSPCRTAIMHLFKAKKECYLIAGINLPLVMEAYMQRNSDLQTVLDHLAETAKDNVINVNERLLKVKENSEDE